MLGSHGHWAMRIPTVYYYYYLLLPIVTWNIYLNGHLRGPIKPVLHGNTNRIQLVVCSKISPCVIHYYLFDTTSKSRIWLFLQSSMVLFQTINRIRFSCFDHSAAWVCYLFILCWHLNVNTCTHLSTFIL